MVCCQNLISVWRVAKIFHFLATFFVHPLQIGLLGHFRSIDSEATGEIGFVNVH